jgi:hypothetical protein
MPVRRHRKLFQQHQPAGNGIRSSWGMATFLEIISITWGNAAKLRDFAIALLEAFVFGVKMKSVFAPASRTTWTSDVARRSYGGCRRTGR